MNWRSLVSESARREGASPDRTDGGLTESQTPRGRDVDEIWVNATVLNVARRYFVSWPDREELLDEVARMAMGVAVRHWRRIRKSDHPDGWVAIRTVRICRRIARDEGGFVTRTDHDGIAPAQSDSDISDRLSELRFTRCAIIILHLWLGQEVQEISALVHRRPATVSRYLATNADKFADK